MNRNEITLQEMFSSVIRELREGGRWGTAHIYQSAVNAFSAFTKWQPMPMRKLSPTVLKRFENFLRQRNCSWNTVSTYIKTVRSVYHRAVDRKYIRYVPRLFEHVYTGTRADRKKALEASDISSLVRETERSLQRGTLPNTQQRTRIFFVLMFMLRGIPFVDLAYLHKRDLQGNVLSYRRRKTGRALTVSLTPEAMQMVRMVANRNPDSPLSVSHPAERGRHGSRIPGIPVGTQGIQPAAGSTQAVPGNAVGTQYLCSQTHLGHNGLPLRDTPRNHIGSHGALLHHGDGNLSEAFQQQKD